MKKIPPALWFVAFAAVVFGSVIALAALKPSPDELYDDFAKCLTDSGAKMYGSWWCGHCKAQKELFGNSFGYIDYTECSNPGEQATRQVCTDAGIDSFPTWTFGDGSSQSGELDFEYLSEKTGCELPKN